MAPPASLASGATFASPLLFTTTPAASALRSHAPLVPPRGEASTAPLAVGRLARRRLAGLGQPMLRDRRLRRRGTLRRARRCSSSRALPIP
ncbi:hypothetical protein AB1Y20_013073 [Prymnesium parvum]|uniref:Uncharacterized protein n=1 Tax=Prymnesium parvum TaxID=97485 RepID=A0AB34IMH8_PRYPA